MKVHLIRLLVYPLILLMLSCAGDQEFRITHEFPDANWHRFDKLSFNIPVNKTESEYTLYAIIRHLGSFEPGRIPIHCIMTFPSGEERIWEQTIQVRDLEGNFRGIEKSGVYELEVVLRSRISFREPGTATLSIEQIIPKYDTPGIISFGLEMVKK